MNNIFVNNIQRICFHDGPGIRTTIFLNSCLLKCPWCANPETSFFKKIYYVNEKCELNNEKCAYGLNCNGKASNNRILEKNYLECPVEAICKNVHEYSVKELEKIILEDEFIYKDGGGVTFSGGEPLLQSKNLSKLCKNLKERKIHITIETCLYNNRKNLEEIINLIDLFIVDIKILEDKISKGIINGNLDNYLDNIDLLFKNNKKVIFRIPLIEPYITNEFNLNKIYEFLKKYKPIKVELFKGHNLAKEKYLRLGLSYKKVETIDDNKIKIIQDKIKQLKIDVEIMSF